MLTPAAQFGVGSNPRMARDRHLIAAGFRIQHPLWISLHSLILSARAETRLCAWRRGSNVRRSLVPRRHRPGAGWRANWNTFSSIYPAAPSAQSSRSGDAAIITVDNLATPSFHSLRPCRGRSIRAGTTVQYPRRPNVTENFGHVPCGGCPPAPPHV